MILGCYLGLATNVGSALTAKILNPHGQFVCRTMLWHLNNEELQSSVHLEEHPQFNKSISTHFGPVATAQTFMPKS